MNRTGRCPWFFVAVAFALAAMFSLPAAVGGVEAARDGAGDSVAFTSDRREGPGVRNPTGDAEIFTVRADRTGLRQLTFNEADDYAPEYSSDGENITFSSDRDAASDDVDDIFTMRADGSNQRNVTRTPDEDDSFSVWSPSGRSLAFTSLRDGNFEIYRIRADGSNQRNLTQNPADDSVPSWSPEGDRIAFNSSRNGDYEIFTVRPDGSGARNITRAPGSNEIAPVWSPDAGQLAFASDRDDEPFVLDIFKIERDGSEPENLTETPGAIETFSSWSPDGDRLAFDSDRRNPFSGNEDIFTMRADGSGQRGLSGPPPADDYAPSWRPTGTVTVRSGA